ncbi:hypothetical protein ESA94_02775 [Lacibacter luteus]|uniref:Uncharacterized protein n=1 Tax=Lacibacter luteus TaxID=2508719 RepID=A0A4Q1CMD9_9BACT|nr:PLDc N-terminal domain-containing protein [Lacibacter luteus]RXK61954.1 hypothetical protein ESA94_02775 [Lacibacter luteus]
MELVESAMGGFLYLIFLFLLIAIPLTFILAVWKRNDISQASKIMWMLFFVVAPFISIICYLLFGYKPSRER